MKNNEYFHFRNISDNFDADFGFSMGPDYCTRFFPRFFYVQVLNFDLRETREWHREADSQLLHHSKIFTLKASQRRRG